MNNKLILLAMAVAGLVGVAVGYFGLALFRPVPSGDPALTEAALREVFREHPDIVLEALQTLQNRRGETERARQRNAIAANRAALLEDPNSFVAGNPEGDVTLVEFFDYRCPYCRQAMATVQALLKADSNLRVVYKEFPVLGAESLTAARLAVAARQDPRYEALHAALMTAPGPLSGERVLQIAAGLGFDPAAMIDAMKAPEVEDILRANHALAQELGVKGTPAFVIGDTLTPGLAPIEDLKRQIAQARTQAKAKPPGKADGAP